MTQKLTVPVDHVYIDLQNPRFLENALDEDQAIERLCKAEDIYELAKHIAENGINEMQNAGVIKDGRSYIAVDGNRRLCAIKLLHDPERAPDNLKHKFRKLSAESGHTIEQLTVSVYNDRTQAAKWLLATHGDPGKGIGMKPWNAQQKTRFSQGQGSKPTKNKDALMLVDYVVDKGMFTYEDFNKSLTTIQRFLANDVFRNVLGLKSIENELQTNRNLDEFDYLVRKFLTDVMQRRVDSRKHNTKEQINDYANRFLKDAGVSDERYQPTSIQKPQVKQQPKEGHKPENAKSKREVDKLPVDPSVQKLLGQIKNKKLSDFLLSLQNLKLDSYNVPLATIGCWAFVECLSAMHGRKSNETIVSYFNKSKLRQLEIYDRGDIDVIISVLRRLKESANITKHHYIGANYNKDQLINDMACLRPLIEKVLKDMDKG